jgi:hypothetical protein
MRKSKNSKKPIEEKLTIHEIRKSWKQDAIKVLEIAKEINKDKPIKYLLKK